MAVVIGTRTGFELVEGAAAEDVRRGTPLSTVNTDSAHSTPRPLYRLEPHPSTLSTPSTHAVTAGTASTATSTAATAITTPGPSQHTGPRVLRRFEDTRRPGATPRTAPLTTSRITPGTRPMAVRTPLEAPCESREDRHPALQFALYAAATVAAAVALSLFYLFASGATTVPERTSVVHVQVGESLEEVAQRAAPNSDPDAVAERIRSLNNLTNDTPITPGQPLVVPDGRSAPTP